MNFWAETKEIFKNTGLHFRTGVSYMLPVILIGGMLGSIAVLGGQNPGEDSIWHLFKQVGEIGLDFFVPIMAAYIAFSIADTPGLAPGIIIGILAQQTGTGYIGALLGAILVGYITAMLLKVELPDKLSMVQSSWGMIIPVISTAAISLFLVFVVGPPIAWLMDVLTEFLTSLGESGSALMGTVLGGLGGIDYGGPFSKTQSTFATAVLDMDLYTPLGICGAIVTVPPLGLALATFLAPKLWTKTEKEYAKNSWMYAIIAGFTEIAIPLAAGDIFRATVATVAGSMVTGTIAGFFMLELSTPVLGIPQWFFYNKPFVYGLSVIAGIVTVALVVNTLKKYSNRDIAKIELEETNI